MTTTESLIAEISATIEKRPAQMPMPWAASERAMPNDFIAASVFSALQTSEATFAKKLTLIGEWNGYRLHYKGRRLTQTHADVWQGVMEIAKWNPAGARVIFSARQLLRIMGRPASTKDRKRLHEWITDMQTCLVQITTPDGRGGYAASVFPEAAWEKRADGRIEYSLVLHRMLCESFARGYSLVSWDQRKLLGRNSLALWLQQYITAFPMAVPVATLHSLSGAPPTQRLADFRRKLTAALKTLQKVGVVTEWRLSKARAEQLVVEQPRRLSANTGDPLSLKGGGDVAREGGRRYTRGGATLHAGGGDATR